jgi:hypothetical protein
VLWVGTASDGGSLLIENGRGMHAAVVDPFGEVQTHAGESAALGTIKRGGRIGVAVSTWAGMQIVGLVVIAPRLTANRVTAR